MYLTYRKGGKPKLCGSRTNSARLLGVDSITGLETWHVYDAMEDKTHIEYAQDVGPLMDHCAYLRTTDQDDKGMKKSFMLGAKIPEILKIIWKKKYGISDYKDPAYWRTVKRLLNGPYKNFKTTNRKL